MALQNVSTFDVFPMDSAVVEVDSDGLPVYDRPYNATMYRKFSASLQTNGVLPGYLNVCAPSKVGEGWYVDTGSVFIDGTIVNVENKTLVALQSDIPTGSYLYIGISVRLDMAHRDGSIHGRLSTAPSEAPIRTDSEKEVFIARVDWRGTMIDFRPDASKCGFSNALREIDADSFMAELKTAVSQFELNVGHISTLPPGTMPEITVRKPDTAGEPVYIDFAIPRGPKGDPGKDADRPPTVYMSPEDKEPPAEPGNVWFVDSEGEGVHTISDIRCYETRATYPGESLYPAYNTFPGYKGRWASHKLSPSIIASE